MNITSDAGFLQVDLNGLTVTGIEMSKNGQNPSELELAGNTNGLIQWLTGSSAFTSYSQNGAVGTPHAGYTGNYRQTVFSWSMQINTNTNGAEIDIDPLNPSDSLIGLIGHGLWQVLPNLLTGGDTDPNKTLKALQNRHINVPQCQ